MSLCTDPADMCAFERLEEVAYIQARGDLDMRVRIITQILAMQAHAQPFQLRFA